MINKLKVDQEIRNLTGMQIAEIATIWNNYVKDFNAECGWSSLRLKEGSHVKNHELQTGEFQLLRVVHRSKLQQLSSILKSHYKEEGKLMKRKQVFQDLYQHQCFYVVFCFGGT